MFRDELIELYVNQGLTIRQIANLKRMPYTVTWRCLDRFNIERRPTGRRKGK